MTGDPQALSSKRPGRFTRAAAFALLGASLAPGWSVHALAQAPAPAEADLFDLSRVPADVSGALVARPGAVFKLPGFAPVVELLGMADSNRKQAVQLGETGPLKLPFAEIDGLAALVFLAKGDDQKPTDRPPVVLIRTTKPQDWKAATEALVPDPEPLGRNGATYFRTKGETGKAVYVPIDDRTILFGPEAETLRVLDARKGPKVAHPWDADWSRLEKGQAAIVIDASALRTLLPPTPPGEPSPLGPVAPLVDNMKTGALTLDLARGVSVRAALTATTEKGAKTLAETAGALVTLGKNALPQFRAQLPPPNNPGAKPARVMLELSEALLKDARAESQGMTATFHAGIDKDAGGLIAQILPSVQSARAAARRAQSTNNMKQIGLAMHNYLAANNHFPPAAGKQEGSKFPHSWRVAILPFIEQQELYNEYKFDEAWDSPSNKKLIEKMPATFAFPGEDRTKGKPAYFVLTGPTTIFPGGEDDDPVGLEGVTDGTSNTILTVEAKRDIPWTKPEDIPFDPEKFPDKKPEVGGFTPGGFNVGFADGSVRRLSDQINTAVFKALLSRNGGEVISSDAIAPPDEDEPKPE